MTNHNYIATNLDRLNNKMDKILLVLEALKDAASWSRRTVPHPLKYGRVKIM